MLLVLSSFQVSWELSAEDNEIYVVYAVAIFFNTKIKRVIYN